eukprot:COSAG04_NODE_147_length_22902_cov_55.666184_25_plen_102_part_00
MLTPQDMLFGVGILIALALFTLWDRCTRKSGVRRLLCPVLWTEQGPCCAAAPSVRADDGAPLPQGAPSYPTPKECTTEGCTNFGNGLAEDSGQCNACAKKI